MDLRAAVETRTRSDVSQLQFEASDILSENAASTKASSGLAPPASSVLFARSHDGDVFWGIHANDRVHGYGRGSPEHGGCVYGAGLPFDAWLADFVADLG